MSANHTPGPWFESDPGHIRDQSLQLVAVVQHGINAKANARLIAAAPELLEALKALIGHDHDDPLSGWRGHGGDDILFECEYCRAKHEDVTLIPHSDDCPVAKGRAAIAKATGEQA